MSAQDDVPHVVVLTPVFNEQATLLLYEKTVRATLLERTDVRFEVLFIDDGSTDRSWETVRAICRADARFRGIRLARNFGSHVALSAGLNVTAGDADAVATLACDLQDPPETILRFVEQWRAGAQIVWGERNTRADSFWRIASSRLFEALMRRYAMPRGSKFTTGTFLLLDRKVAQCVCQFQEQSRIVFALVAWTGFEQAVVRYDRRARTAGKSGWNVAKMFRTMYDAFIGFSSLPVRLMTLLGGLAVASAGGLSAYILYGWAFGHPLPGWTSTMFGMAFFFGIQFLLMGLSGEYLHRIYLEVVKRPLYFLSEQTWPEKHRAESPAETVAHHGR